MTAFQVEMIVFAGQQCERHMALESAYVSAGMFLDAAECAEVAEQESAYAFELARRA
ncbi:hypothetical protein [Dyella japonica]|uniref:Uncharacterized protein n=1 Tax=Dyella japonica TaxID=231455 RepID=A0ABV2JS05_9GAMM